MDLSQLFELHDITTAILVGAGGYMMRWAGKVNRGLSETVKAAELLRVQLNGHEELDEKRDTEINRRVDDLQRVVYSKE